ncbi:MAG: hypothetical protein M3Z33_09935 [Actinomycetota bacterium]|nr:hypothetical protein [Actinomycetota bacterium]
MPDYLETARKAIQDQLASLREEVQRLEAAHAALDAGGGRRRGPGRPRGSGKASGPTRRRRRSSSPTRADQANDLVQANPGITIPELAQRMGIKQNYLYRVLPTLQKEKKVVKRGKGWHPAAQS